MNVCRKWCGRALAVILLPCFALTAARVQAQDNTSSLSGVEQGRSAAAEMRGADEAALRQLFSSEQAQQALKSRISITAKWTSGRPVER